MVGISELAGSLSFESSAGALTENALAKETRIGSSQKKKEDVENMLLQLSEAKAARLAQPPIAVADASPYPPDGVDEMLQQEMVQLCFRGDLEGLKCKVEEHGNVDGKLLRSCGVIFGGPPGAREARGIISRACDTFQIFHKNNFSPCKSSCMQYAAYQGFLHIVQYLLEQGVEGNHHGCTGGYRKGWTNYDPRNIAVSRHGRNSKVAKLLPESFVEKCWASIGSPDSLVCTNSYNGDLVGLQHMIDGIHGRSRGSQWRFLHAAGYVELPGGGVIDEKLRNSNFTCHALYTPDGGQTFALLRATDKEFFPDDGPPPKASALQYAAFSGKLNMVNYFLEHRSGVHPKYIGGGRDAFPWTPRIIAERKQEEAQRDGEEERAREYGAVVQRLRDAESGDAPNVAAGAA